MYSGVCIVGLHSWTAGKDRRPPTRTIHTPSALLPLTAQVSLLRTHKRLYKWGVGDGGGREGRKEEGGHCQMEFEKPQRKAAMLGGDVGKIPLLFGKSRVLLSLLECIRIPSRVAKRVDHSYYSRDYESESRVTMREQRA